MADKIKILVVDDHPLMIDGIINALKKHDQYEVSYCNTCDDAYKKLKENTFDVLFTDLSFENLNDESELDGGEALIRKVKSDEIPVKIGVVTGHTETNRVFNVINNLSPNAYILKSHCSGDELHFAVQQMLKNMPFYTHEIHQKILKRNIVQIQMDEVAIQILKELPKQSKIVNLEGKIRKSDGNFMKIRAIENKLANLRIDLNAKNNTDLVLKAKELGIID